jgi:hypothetical protein
MISVMSKIRFYKKLEKKSNTCGSMDRTALQEALSKPTWRLLISYVYLGNCFIEKKMNFKEFAYFGELKVLELLK